MSNKNIELPFALGETVWHAAHRADRTWVECPECLGTKTIKVTLATGEEYELGCAACSRGYEPSSGKVEKTEHRFKPTLFTPQRFSIDSDGVRYSESIPDATAYAHVSSNDLFVSEEACAARCSEENKRLDKEWAERELQNLMSKRKDYAWSVHYWRRQLADKRKDIERIEQRLVQIKERSSGAKPSR